MLFTDYQSEVKRRISREISGADVDVYVKRWINTAAKTLSLEAKWKCLRREDTITTVDGTENYVLPPDYGRIGFFWHRVLGYNYRVQPLVSREFVSSGFVGTTEGIPYWYRFFEGGGNVLAQPAAASVISVVSSAASGDSTQKILIEGVVSGYPDNEELSLNNATKVTGSKSFSHIYRINKSASTTGRVTVTDAVPATIAILPVGLVSSTLRRRWVKFYYIPDTDDQTIYNYYYSKIFNMVGNYESTPFDEEFDEAIIRGAVVIGEKWEESQPEKALHTDAMYNNLVKKLRRVNLKDDDWIPLLKSMDRRSSIMSNRVLNFGAHYPYVRY